MNTPRRPFFAAVLALIAPALAGQQAPASLVTSEVVIDGSSTVFPIVEAAAIELERRQAELVIHLGVSGTGGGFRKFCAGATDLSNASRPIKASEMLECAKAGVRFIELPIALDGLTVAVHPSNHWSVCLKVEELRRLWRPAAEGRLKTWADLRPGWPKMPIELYGPGRDSGTYDYFTLAIVGKEGSSRLDFIGSEDDYLLAQNIAGRPHSLGFFGFAYFREYASRLRAVAIDSGQGCVLPTVETIVSGTYQPLSRPIFVYVALDRLERPAVRNFVDFLIGNGKTLAEKAGYVALSDRSYRLVAERLSRKVVGSNFEGGSKVGLAIEEVLARAPKAARP